MFLLASKDPRVTAFAPTPSVATSTAVGRSCHTRVQLHRQHQAQHEPAFDFEDLSTGTGIDGSGSGNGAVLPSALLLASAAAIMDPTVASAVSIPEAIPSIDSFAASSSMVLSGAFPASLAAYGHYISILGMTGCIVAERFTIKPGMSEDEEQQLFLMDTAYGVFGVLMLYTGYLRMSVYEKGFDFYSHEPLFWLKLVFVAVFAASSLFNTTVLVKRSFIDKSPLAPISEPLAERMIRICNAELTALVFIPLTATTMARGIGYNEYIPWPVGAILVAGVFGGLTFKYVKEAIELSSSSSSSTEAM